MYEGNHRAPVRRRSRLLIVALVMGLLATAPMASAASDIGTSENPVRLSLAVSQGDTGSLVAALENATGLEFVVDTPGPFPDPRGYVDWLCDPAYASMRIAFPIEYVFAHKACKAKSKWQLDAEGTSPYRSAFFVPDNSAFETLDELFAYQGPDPLTWVHVDASSVSSYIVPLGMMGLAGMELPVTNEVVFNDHPSVICNLDSSNDPYVFGTTFWDARVLAENCPDVRLLGSSNVIDNNPVVFGPDFPNRIRKQIEAAMRTLDDSAWGAIYPTWQGEQDVSVDLVKLEHKEFKLLTKALEAAGIELGNF